MVKMEFLKRKHFSLWIIATLFVLLSGSLLDGTLAVQGVPTWICLGVKSPFIEFSNNLEVLANNSIPLNITKDEQALMHQEGLRKLGTFIKPVDLRDSTTGFVKENLTKKIPTSTTSRRGAQMQRRVHPIQEEMDQKQIILLDEDTDENGLPASLTDEDRKFIVPMALKNASPDPRIPITTPRATTSTRSTNAFTTRRMTTPATPEFASNIDDLKKHILFLQNMTKHDSNFQSKFVVFPSLQKDKQKTVPTAAVISTTIRPQRPIFPYSPPIAAPTRRVPVESKVPPFDGYYHNEEEPDMSVFLQPTDKNARDKITIVPQVLLLNDHKTKSYDNDVNMDGVSSGNRGRTRINVDRPTVSSLTPSSTTTTTTSSTTTETTTRRITRPTKLPACVRNPDSPKCIRQRKREELQRMRDREQLLREQEEYLRPHYEPYIQTLNNTKRFAVSIEIPDSFKIPLNESGATQESYITSAEISDLQILSRARRSPGHKRRNIGGGVPGRSGTGPQDKFSAKYGGSAIGYYERDAVMPPAAVNNNGGRDFLFTNVDQFNGMRVLPNSTLFNTTMPGSYSEPIDLNPDNCYAVEGMTSGQKKQCALHTSVMPAISRGARATIQECQFQFKNRRWNCSTTDDNTVFGPMTGLGSPEMAFIHALAAATVTSFIARACRDGQLASCGCSRGSRPKQLHDDWTWGGCGDNLEYAYKFATDFIDVREKETRRGTRGAGHPEKKRGRFHEQQRRKLHQMMQADDASAAHVLTSDGVNVTTKQQQQQKSSGIAKEHINGGKNNQEQKKQQLTNKTVNADSADINNNNNNNNKDSNNKMNATLSNSKGIKISTTSSSTTTTTTTTSTTMRTTSKRTASVAPPRQEFDSSEEYHGKSNGGTRIKPEDLLELQERITKEILNTKLQEKEMLALQENINREILNSKVFNMDNGGIGNGVGGGGARRKKKRKNQRAVNGLGNTLMADASSNANNNNNNIGMSSSGGGTTTTTTNNNNNNKWKNGISAKARSLMNLHNNEAGRRAVIKKTRITCKCHGVSGSCSLITCWQQLSSIREIGDYLREKYEESTEVKLNKRGRLQVKDAQYKVPTAHDLVYMDESPDWCRSNRQLQWSGTHGRICNKTSAGLDGCGILCCGRGYNTKNIVVRERCNCKFHWCCQVKCDVCVKVLEEHTCK